MGPCLRGPATAWLPGRLKPLRTRQKRAQGNGATKNGAEGAISDVIADVTGHTITSVSGVGRSGWAAQAVYETAGGPKYFVKTASESADAMFTGEALGLTALHDTGTVRIPEVVAVGDLSHGSYIVLEHLTFGGRGDQADLGRALARMHAAVPSDPVAAGGAFGFAVDNTIGGTPQPNGWEASWPLFYRDRRLMHQARLTGDAQLIRLAEGVADRIETLFEGVDVAPSVLHGDMWSGNIATVGGQPALFDPATYYGHSEAEFGMSWCAGLGQAFYNAYWEVMPKQRGFEARRDLYLVYHYLNHYNLFGSSYYSESERLLQKLQRAVS